MSVSTGTRPLRTVQSRSNEALIEADKELINSLKIFSEGSNSVAGLTGTPAQNSPKTPAGNYLAREGDSMIGPLALGPPLDFRIEVDANNTIDIGPLSDNAQFASNVQLDDFQPNSSVLDIISNAAFDGQILILRTFAPTTPYTISQGTLANGGNIQTGDGNNLTVGDLQTVTLIFDESLKIEANTGGSWRIISVSSGTGGLSEPVILTINTITPQTLPTTSVIDWSKNPNQITLDRAVEFSFSNLPPSGSYEGVLVIIDIDATGGFASPVWPGSLTNPPIVPTTALTRTSVMLYTINGGTVVTHATSVGSSSGGGSISQWATFPAVADIDYATFDGINIDRLLFDQAAGGSLAVGVTGITSDASGNMLFNIPANTLYSLRSNGLSILSVDNTSADLVMALFARDAEIPIFQLTRLDSTPTVGTEVGRIAFVGVDSTGITQEEFARITVDSEDLTIGSVDGSMHLQVDLASFSTAFISLNNSNDNKVSIFKNLFMQTGIDIEVNGNDIIFDSTGTNLINADTAGLDLRANGAGDTIQMHSDGVIHTFSATGLQLGVTADLDLFARAVRITPGTATFLADGDISYNSTSNLFVFRQNGADVNLGGGGGTTFADDVFRIQAVGDLTKELAFNVGAITTATTRTITMLNEDLTIVGRSSTQTIQNKSFEDSNTVFIDTIAPTKKMGFDISSVTAGQTRIMTIQDQNGTLALLEGAAQTWTGVNTYSGKVNINADMDIGNADTDTVTITSKIDSNLIPSGATRNLGNATTDPWNNIFSDNTLFCSNFKVFTGDSDINVFDDFDMQAGATVDFADTATTAGTSTQTLPAQPAGFIVIKVNGVSRRVPFYVP